jgi:hypothetical protein
VEWLKNQVPAFKPGARVARATLEIEGELGREEDFSEDMDLVELSRAAYVGRDWPIGCILAVVNVPVIHTPMLVAIFSRGFAHKAVRRLKTHGYAWDQEEQEA